MLWESRPRSWSDEEVGERLFVAAEVVRRILRNLHGDGLIADGGGRYVYASSPDRDAMLAAVDATYRRELVRVTNLIHSKAPGAVRDFARAVEFARKKKE